MADSESNSIEESVTANSVGESNKATVQENQVNEDIDGLKPSMVCSPATTSKQVLSCPRLKCLSGQSSSINTNKSTVDSVLRPSQFSVAQKTPQFVLSPSRLNPFAKPASEEKESEKQNGSSLNGDSPKFLPLVHSDNSKKTESNDASTSTIVTPVTQNCTFVFGENIQDRVVADVKAEEARSSYHASTNGTSDMLFSSAVKDTTSTSLHLNKETKSLSESAREYEESRAVKRKYEEVEVKTGEEGEVNVVQITCKLFAYDNGNWQERGRGILRLNDRQETEEQQAHSRLVFRASGSLRVVLNTKIWAKMSVQQASPKSVRLTAFDNNGDVKVFLVTGQPDEMKHLFKQLDARVHKEIEKLEEPCAKRSDK